MGGNGGADTILGYTTIEIVMDNVNATWM